MDQQLCTPKDLIDLTEQGKSALNNFITLVKKHDKAVDEKNTSTYIEGFSLIDTNHVEENPALIGNSAGEIIVNGLAPKCIRWQEFGVKTQYDNFMITKKLIYNKYHSCFTLLALYAKLHANATAYSTTFNTIKEKHDRYFKWADVLAPVLGTLALMTGWLFWIIKYPTQAKTAFMGCGAAATGLWIYCRAWWAPSLAKTQQQAWQTRENFLAALNTLAKDIEAHPGILYSNPAKYKQSHDQETNDRKYSGIYIDTYEKDPFHLIPENDTKNRNACDFLINAINNEIKEARFKNEGDSPLLYALQQGTLLPLKNNEEERGK